MQINVRWIFTLVAVIAAIPAAAGNIGFLDADRAVRTVKEGQRQLDALEAWANSRNQQIEEVQSRVSELNRRLNAERTIASADAVKQLEDELLQAQRDLEDAGRTLQGDFQDKQRELLAQVATRVRTVAGEYAAANGFDAILLLDGQPLVYIADSAIITDAVIRLYDERFPIE